MNLVEGLSREIARVTELREQYGELPANAGAFAMTMMAKSLEDAHRAIGSNDTQEMMKAYQDLQEYTD